MSLISIPSLIIAAVPLFAPVVMANPPVVVPPVTVPPAKTPEELIQEAEMAVETARHELFSAIDKEAKTIVESAENALEVAKDVEVAEDASEEVKNKAANDIEAAKTRLEEAQKFKTVYDEAIKTIETVVQDANKKTQETIADAYKKLIETNKHLIKSLNNKDLDEALKKFHDAQKALQTVVPPVIPPAGETEKDNSATKMGSFTALAFVGMIMTAFAL